MRRPCCLLLLLLASLHLVHAQEDQASEPELDGVWVDATSNAKAWLDSGNSLPFPVAFSPESVGMSSPHLAEADSKIWALVKDGNGREGRRSGWGKGREGLTSFYTFLERRGCSSLPLYPHALPPSLPPSLPPLPRQDRGGFFRGDEGRSDRDHADLWLRQRRDRAAHPGGTSPSLPPSLPPSVKGHVNVESKQPIQAGC
jgi:hypothetical protein